MNNGSRSCGAMRKTRCEGGFFVEKVMSNCRFDVDVSIYLVGVMNKKGRGEDVENTDALDNVIAIL